MAMTILWPSEEALHGRPVVFLTALQSSLREAPGTHIRDMETEA